MEKQKEKCPECGVYVDNLGFILECEYCLSKREE